MKTDIYTSGEYLKNNPTWDIEHSPWKAGYILDILKKNGLSPSSVCEIGCGAGGILTELAGRMPESVSFTGYEISPQAYELAKTKENGRIKFILKDITADKDAFFDIALVIDVVEHVQDYMGFLKP
jgi:2-polyprenyl-3-methyl-5-hydroxy-6-metoxy-1,4-benzoquinol methylase